jgi:hypothetical protein
MNDSPFLEFPSERGRGLPIIIGERERESDDVTYSKLQYQNQYSTPKGVTA